jgi:hypothetical protein
VDVLGVMRQEDAATPTAATDSAKVLPLPWRTLGREALWIWLVWQAILLAVTYAALTFTFHAQGTPDTTVATPDALISAWVRHDSAWYLWIAERGYWVPRALTFFPVYPLLIHLLTPLCFGNAPLAAVLIARLADYALCLSMLALAWQELGPRLSSARLALALTLVYPLAFFFAAAYTEPIFLAEAALVLLFSRRRAWLWAALIAFVAGLTRPSGLVLLLPIAWEWARATRPWANWRNWRIWRDGVLAVGAVPAAYLVMMVISWFVADGQPLAFIHVHGQFDRVALPPWEIARLLIGVLYRAMPGSFTQAHNLSDVGMVLAFALIVIVGAVRRSMPIAFVLYMAGLIVLVIASPTPALIDPFVSSGRFLTAAIPVFLLLAVWAERRPWLTWLLVGGGLSLQAILAAFFLNGGWLI